MKKEIFFYGSVIVNCEDDETAISKATEFINENPRDFCEVRDIEENEN